MKIREITAHARKTALATACGTILATGSDDKTAKLWDVTSGALISTLEGHAERISDVAFSPDGQYGLSGSGDRTLKLWDLRKWVGASR